MRDPYDAIAGGPYRSDLHRSAVEATAADLTGQDRPAPPVGASVGGVSEGMAISVWSGGRKGPQRAPQPMAQSAAVATEIKLTPFGAGLEIMPDSSAWIVHSDGTRERSVEYETTVADLVDDLAYGGDLAGEALGAIYARAARILAAVPSLLLAGTKPWAESDETYRAKLLAHAPFLDRDDWRELNAGSSLDEIGAEVGLPRPRLVRAEG